jgi:hypothetical protein
MNFCTEYPALEPSQQEQFQRVVTRLLQGDVLVPGAALRPDPDWRFVERYRELLNGYLEIGGWYLDLDPALRLARAIHKDGAQRVRLSKLESLVLCVLRLLYHESMQQVSEDVRCEVTVGELRERLIAAGRPIHTVSLRILRDVLRRLSKHSLISLARGFDGEDHEAVVIDPVIEKVLPSDRILEWGERVRAYTGGSEDDEDDGESADAPESGTDAERAARSGAPPA